MKKVFLKYILHSFSLVVLSIVCSVQTSAQVTASKSANSKTSLSETTKGTNVVTTPADSEKVDNLKARALQEIDRRMRELTLVKDKSLTLHSLSEKVQSSQTTQIASEIASLTALKETISNETNLVTLKKEVQRLITSYNVFALYVPKIHILISSEMIDDTADKIASLAATAQPARDTASTSGEKANTKSQNSDTLSSLLASIHANAAAARTAVLPITPSTYPANKTTLQKARTLLVNAREELAEARQQVAKALASPSTNQ